MADVFKRKRRASHVDKSWCLKRHRVMYAKGAVQGSEANDGSSIWPRLPLHIIVQDILFRLPLLQLCRLRCVCKAWNAILGWGGSVACEKFPDDVQQQSSGPPEEEEYWFVVRCKHEDAGFVLRAVSTHDDVGLCFPLPLFGDRLLSRLGGMYCREVCVNASSFGTPASLMASAGGLICALVHTDRSSRYCDVIVFNCLTGSVRVLPHPPPKFATEGAFIFMAIDEQDPFRYYVMLTFTELMVDNSCTTVPVVFDSRTGSWKKTGSWNKTGSKSNSWLEMLSGDFFHFTHARSRYELLAYNVARDVWSSVSMPAGERHTPLSTLHKYKGRLFQARHLVCEADFRSFAVWQLQLTDHGREQEAGGSGNWMEVSRTPQHLLQHQPACTQCHILAEGGLFFIKSFDKDGHPTPTLVYDVDRNLWYVPPLGLEEGKDLLFVHRPRLSMLFW